jgi:hypothetical protein
MTFDECASIVTLSVIYDVLNIYVNYANWHYAECRCA